MSETESRTHPQRAIVTSTLKQAQKFSAFGIMGFAGLHLTSTVLLPPVSVPIANKAFMVGRSVYQSYFGEWALVYAAFGVHVLSGLTLRALRAVWHYEDTGAVRLPKVSTVSKSGFVLSFLSFTHYLSTRYSPQQALGDSSLINLDYITYCLNTERVPVSIALVLLTTVYVAHAGLGARYYFRVPRLNKYVLLLVAGLATLAVTALTNQPVPTGWLAEQYELAHGWLKETLKARVGL